MQSCVTRLAHAELHLHTHTPLSTHMSASAQADPNDRTQREFERRMCMQLNQVVAVPTSTSPAQQRVKYGAALSKGVACVQRPNLNVYEQAVHKHVDASNQSDAWVARSRCERGRTRTTPNTLQGKVPVRTAYVWPRAPCCPALSPPLPPAWCHAELLPPWLLFPSESQCRAGNPAIPPWCGPALAAPTPTSEHACSSGPGASSGSHTVQ
jgi:hypothetical protein